MNVWLVAIVKREYVSQTDKSENWTLVKPIYSVTGWGKLDVWKQELLANASLFNEAKKAGNELIIKLMEFKYVSIQ